MQDRATTLKRPSKAFAFLTLFFCTSVFAQNEDDLKLPPKFSELRPQDESTNTKKVIDGDELASLKTSIKLEVIEELRGDSNFNWEQTVSPKLNFLELSGYFRVRAEMLNRCDLGTFVPSLNIGTSQCSPPLSYFAQNPTSNDVSGDHVIISSNMRFRLDPTLNVSEDIRVRGRIDVFDNLVLGSTAAYMTGVPQPNPSAPIAALSHSVVNPLLGLNSERGGLSIKRLWGEVSFPYGELRFGRMPFGWGLGILYSAGDDQMDDFGNNADGVFFATRLAGFHLVPGMTVSYAGPSGTGGGLGTGGGDANTRWFVVEGGNNYDLDPSDNVYNFHLSFFRKDSPNEIQALLDENRIVWNYGFLGTYRLQINDTMYTQLSNAPVPSLRAMQVTRSAHIGLMSLWSKFQWGHLVIEGEAAGIFGQIGNGTGLWSDPVRSDAIWVYQGGFALESRYGFLQDRLQVGLDTGWASGDPSPGFGLRPGLNKTPADGQADGQQFGDDNALTNFAFDRDYKVDMMLFREVLGTVTDAFYLKPHIAYYFSEYLGLRADVISSMTNFARSAPGNNNFLGVEVDASLFFKTVDGFFFSLQYGHLFPFDGLSHDPGSAAATINGGSFGKAASASALRAFAAISF